MNEGRLKNSDDTIDPIDLTFDLAEEIAEIGSPNSDAVADIMQRLRTPLISAVVRLAKVKGGQSVFLPRIKKTTPQIRATFEAIAGTNVDDLSLEPHRWEVRSIPRVGGDQNLAWHAFLRRLHGGVSKAHLSSGNCKAVAYAMIELAENVIEHSECPATGTAYYQQLTNRFEFGVADSGIGILSSLRRNPHYAFLDDDVSAIRRSIEDGVSRFEGQGRGNGFRTIFRVLRNSSAEAFIRSGSGGLKIHPRESGHDRIGIQRGNYQGLWVSISLPTPCR